VPRAARANRARPGGPSAVSVWRAGPGQAAVRTGSRGRGRLTARPGLPLCSLPIRSSPPCSGLRPTPSATAARELAAGAASSAIPSATQRTSEPPISCTAARRPQQPLPEVPIAGITSRGGRRHWPPARSPNRPFLAAFQPTNRTLRTPRSLPCPPWPDSGGASPEFRRISAGRPPRDHIAKPNFFSRVFLQRVTQIVFVMWLILVNCV
jgi:hypothetical protein